MKLVNIGFGNVIPEEKIIAIVTPDTAPIKRLVQSYRESEHIIDATQGRKTKSVIILMGDFLALSYLQPETIASKIEKRYDGGEK
ncbi:MAG: DUF370 domain-containing protein [Firmicutes bacterium]|nr:DUF370 domain-containing protein [Bacillota bacterium]